MARPMLKNFEKAADVGVAVSKAVGNNSNPGDPSDGEIVEFKMDGATPSLGSAEVPAGSNYAYPILWSEFMDPLNAANHMLQWVIFDDSTMSVVGPTGYSGTITFWVFV